jgi:hypothetical protein
MRMTVIAGFFALLVCCAQSAYACSCAPANGNNWPEPKDFLAAKSYESDDNIFLGRVLKIEDIERPADDPFPMVKVTFAVERYWADSRTGEGVDRSAITISTHKGSHACGFRFEAGGRYFVFAKYFYTSYCTPTTKYTDEDAPVYFKVLGEGRKPEGPKPAERPLR